MGGSTNQTKDPSGTKLYLFNGFKVEIFPCFLYEVCISKYWKNGYCVLGTRYFKSSKLLNIKKDRVYKRYNSYLIEKVVYLLGVPYEFIKENNLSIYEPIVKKSRKNETAH